MASEATQATLIDRGGGLIYDSVLNVTWLQDANYARTSGYAIGNAIDNGSSATNNIFADGRMGWDAAKAWAEQLVYHDSVRNRDYSDWRLPFVVNTGSEFSQCLTHWQGPTCGWNVQTVDAQTMPVTVYSELAYMLYGNLGVIPRLDTNGYENLDSSGYPNWGIFGNGTYNGADRSSFGERDLGLIENLQLYGYWSGTEAPLGSDQAWVASGDGRQVGVLKNVEIFAWAARPGDVPEPGTLALVGVGLAGLVARRRRG